MTDPTQETVRIIYLMIFRVINKEVDQIDLVIDTSHFSYTGQITSKLDIWKMSVLLGIV